MKRIAMHWTGALAAACLLAACEGLFTGTAAESLPLEPNAGGGFKPVKIKLAPDMSPVAINFHADLGNHPHETGKWNAYHASLARGGREVAGRDFNVNYTGTAELAPAHPHVDIAMIAWRVAEGGEYTLSITPLRAEGVVLSNPRVEVRRNVKLPR